MKDYGKLFKKFRESRGLVLKDIAKLGVSVSHISRFERENTDLTISKFMSALNAINMPIDEFMYAANDFQRDEFICFSKERVRYGKVINLSSRKNRKA